jgi:hypothetical protein
MCGYVWLCVVMCGHNVLTFDDLSILAKRLRSTTLLRSVSQDHNVGPMVIVSYTKVMIIAMHREAVKPYKTQLHSLSILLRQVRQWLVSNPANRLYGMLGLSDEETKVDYSLSAAAVYFAYTSHHLMSDADLNLLHAALSSLPMRDLLSWRPNLDSHRRQALSVVLGQVIVQE